MKACAVICRKATVAFPDANPCLFEHKIGVFVRFWGPEPPFLGFSSTKSAFLCAFGLRNPHFRAFRAQNRGFCVRMGDFSEILGCFDTKSGFLCSGGPYRCRRPSCQRPSCRRLSCRGRPRRRRLIWSNAARCGYCQFLVEKEASILRSTASGRL